MSGAYQPMSNRDITDLIAAYPLAWVVSTGDGFGATPLPLLADTDDGGAIVRLLGHMARHNPQRRQLEAAPRALILFQGPQGYISPSWISDRTWAPTWNYATIQIEADIRFLPDEADRALNRLVGTMEDKRERAWSTAEMGERYARLRDGIVAFEADVRSVRGRFKLGQDERPEVLAEIMAACGDEDLKRWMARFYPGRTG